MSSLLYTFAMLSESHGAEGCDLSSDIREVGREILAHLSGHNAWISGEGPAYVAESLGVSDDLGFPRALESAIESRLATL